MKHRLPITMLFLLVALGIYGCAEDPVSIAPPPDWRENLVPDQPGVRVVDLWTGFEEPVRLVVRDQETWVELWATWTENVDPAPAAPAVDFAREMVVIAGMGTRPSGGHAIGIDTIAEGARRITVEVFTVSPGPGCIVTAALTSPAIAVAIPASSKPVPFTTREYVQHCP